MTHQVPVIRHHSPFEKTLGSWRVVALMLGMTVTAVAVWATILNPMASSETTDVPGVAAVQDVTSSPSQFAEFAALFQPREPIPAAPGRSIPLSGAPTEPGEPILPSEPEVKDVLHPTPSWVNVFSPESTLNGQPLSVGDVVTAYDGVGVQIGKATVEVAGKYGLMALYMDDPSTSLDEGAVPGETISFRINGIAALVTGPHEPVWSTNGDVLMLNLAANG